MNDVVDAGNNSASADPGAGARPVAGDAASAAQPTGDQGGNGGAHQNNGAAPSTSNTPTSGGAPQRQTGQSGERGSEVPSPDASDTPDWRSQKASLVPEDRREAFLNELHRSPTEADAWNRFLDLRAHQSRSIVVPPEDDPKFSEKMDDIFTKLGRPEAPDKYEAKWDGPELDELGQSQLQDFKTVVHREGLTNRQYANITGWYNKQRLAEMESAKLQAEETTRDYNNMMRQQWGADYEENTAYERGTLDTYMLPTDREVYDNLVLADGTMLKDHPSMRRMLAKIGRDRSMDDFDFSPLNASRKEDAAERLKARQQELIAQGIRPGMPGYPQQEMDQLAVDAATTRRRSPNDRYMQRR